MGFLSSVVGAVANLGSSVGLDRWKKTQADSERRDFFDYAREANYGNYLRSLREAPSAQRAGLEAAGFNPILAIGQMSPSQFGGSSVSASPTDTFSSKGLLSEGAETANNAKNMYRLQKQQAEANINQIESQAEKNRAEASLASANERLIASREMLNRSQSANYDAQTTIAKHQGELQKFLSKKQILELEADIAYWQSDGTSQPVVDVGHSGAQVKRMQRLQSQESIAARQNRFEDSPEGFLWYLQTKYKDIPRSIIGEVWWDLFGGDNLDEEIRKKYIDTFK